MLQLLLITLLGALLFPKQPERKKLLVEKD